jgi:DNA-binding CsgD family transcriptional regulator
MHWTARQRPTSVDVVLAAALTLSSQVEIWAPRLMPGVGEVTGSVPVLAVTTLAMTVPLALRRAAPLVVLLVVFGAAAVQSWLTTPTEGLSTLAAMMVAAYSSSALAGRGRAVASAATIVVGIALMGRATGDLAFMAIVFGSAWLMGLVVSQRSGQLQQLSGDNRDLAQHLSEATTLLADAQRRQANGGSAPAPDDLAALTTRELDVTRAIATGMSNAEIAKELVISEWTVKTHVASILRKLGLRDRTQVAVAAYQSGLVRPESPPDARNA